MHDLLRVVDAMTAKLDFPAPFPPTRTMLARCENWFGAGTSGTSVTSESDESDACSARADSAALEGPWERGEVMEGFVVVFDYAAAVR
jgi:hypothetical protein